MTEDNRIPEIRELLDEGGWEPWNSEAEVQEFIDRIREILDSAPPAPRVFFPGDPIPPGTVAVARSGHPYENLFADESTTCGLPLVEVAIPSPEEWQAAVDQARAERGVA